MNRTLTLQLFPPPPSAHVTAPVTAHVTPAVAPPVAPAPHHPLEGLMDGPLASLQRYVASVESVLASDCPCRGPAECRMLAHVLEDQMAYIQRQTQVVQQAPPLPGKQGELAAWQQLGRRLRLLHAGLTGCACLASCAAPQGGQSCRVG